jgi:hypothetical protein
MAITSMEVHEICSFGSSDLAMHAFLDGKELLFSLQHLLSRLFLLYQSPNTLHRVYLLAEDLSDLFISQEVEAIRIKALV